MASMSDMNIVLGQGNAIKEVHNVTKQNLELNQQLVAQKTEDEKKEEKSKIREFATTDRVEIKRDEEKENKRGLRDNRKGKKRERHKGFFKIAAHAGGCFFDRL